MKVFKIILMILIAIGLVSAIISNPWLLVIIPCGFLVFMAAMQVAGILMGSGGFGIIVGLLLWPITLGILVIMLLGWPICSFLGWLLDI